MKVLNTLFFSLICISIFSKNKDRIYIDSTIEPRQKKEAILILPGLGSKAQGTEKIANYFFNKGYDIFIPDYISRKSISNCVHNLDDFISKNHLKEYQKLHVFSFILGSWTLNKWLTDNPTTNISTILYDRSPLQERVPLALVKDIPLIIRLVSGKIVKEFSHTPYPPISSEKIHIGILIESTPTKLFTKHKKTALLPGQIIWDAKQFNQPYKDKVYLKINHDEMYYRFDVSGEEIFHFIRNQKFTNTARREPFEDDPLLQKTILK